MVQSWLFDIFNYPHNPDPREFEPKLAQAEYDWKLDTWARAEGWGFDGVFFSEHHFTAYNLSPSPNLLVAALSQRTRTLKMGVLCNVTAFHNPRRLAEETAMLDYLTHGRLEVGLGRGADDLEFKKEGFPLEDSRAWFEESLELMEKAWATPRLTHHGRFFNYEATAIWPRLRRKPIIHVPSLSPETLRWCGTKGYKIACAFMPTSTLKEYFDIYKTAASQSGNPVSPDHMSITRPVFIADSDDEARELAEPALDQVFRLFKEVAIPDDLDHMAPGYEGYSSFFRPFAAEGGVKFEDLQASGAVVVGATDTVRDQLIAQVEEIGCGRVVNWFHFGALTPEQTHRSLQLYAEKVIPALRTVQVG